MRTVTRWCGAALLLLAASCASTIFVRTWVFEKDGSTAALSIWADSFRLERSVEQGLTIFTGARIEQDSNWIFDVETWKLPDQPVRAFEPPIRFVCRIHQFKTAVSILRVTGPKDAPFEFLPRGDYFIRQ